MSVVVVPPLTTAPVLEHDKGTGVTVTSTPRPSDATPPAFVLKKVKRDGKIITVKRPITITVLAGPGASAVPAATVSTKPMIESKAVYVQDVDIAKTTVGSASLSTAAGSAVSDLTDTPTNTAAPIPAEVGAPVKAVESPSISTTHISAPTKAVSTHTATPAKSATGQEAAPAVHAASSTKSIKAADKTPEKPSTAVSKKAAKATKVTSATVTPSTTTTKPSSSAPTIVVPEQSARSSATATTDIIAETQAPAPSTDQASLADVEAATKEKWYQQLVHVDITKVASGFENTANSIEVISNAVTRIGAVLTGDTTALEAAKATEAAPIVAALKKPADDASTGATTTAATAATPQKVVVASSIEGPAGTTAQSGPTTILLTSPTQEGAASATTRAHHQSNVKAAKSDAAGSTPTAPATPGLVLGQTVAVMGLATAPGLVTAATHSASYKAGHAGTVFNQNVSRDASGSNNSNVYNNNNVSGSNNNYSDHDRDAGSNYDDGNGNYDSDGNGGYSADTAMVGGGALVGAGGTEMYDDYMEGDEEVSDSDEDPNNNDTTQDLSIGASAPSDAQDPSLGTAEQTTDLSHEVIDDQSGGDEGGENDEDIEEYNPETDEVYQEGNEEDVDEYEEYNPDTDQPYDDEEDNQEGVVRPADSTEVVSQENNQQPEQDVAGDAQATSDSDDCGDQDENDSTDGGMDDAGQSDDY